jgi:hypothetical protein
MVLDLNYRFRLNKYAYLFRLFFVIFFVNKIIKMNVNAYKIEN